MTLELIELLSNPLIYPDNPEQIEISQTQMSIVFLTGNYAYKIKKPVDLGYLDYTTLEKRRYFCLQELELNRRLSPDVYLQTVAITENDGGVCFGGEGTVIEYAVKMKQLPRDRTMDMLLPQDKVSVAMVEQVARILADFHKRAATDEHISTYGAPQSIKINTDENFTQTEKYIGTTISRERYDLIKTYTETFMTEHLPLLQKRTGKGRIRDCHGDLHAAHVCFSNGISIFDCIEFNDRFRYCDVASEVAFLAMDLDRYERADLSLSFVNAYVEAGGDTGLGELLNFYKCYRAYVRGKVESFKYDDPHLIDKEHILATAKGYFKLAARYTRKKPALAIIFGLVGTGKSTIAEAMRRRLGYEVLSSDVIRKTLAGIPLTEQHFDEFQSGLYSQESTGRTYDELFRQGETLLKEGRSVILDASFMRRADRERARDLARNTGADFKAIECRLDEQAARKRLERRVRKGSISDGRWEIYESQKRSFEPVVELSDANHVILDTSQSRSICVNSVVERIE